jgi:hypothetical protein
MGETSAISHPDFKLRTEATHHLSFELVFCTGYVVCALFVEIFGSWLALEFVKKDHPRIFFYLFIYSYGARFPVV